MLKRRLLFWTWGAAGLGVVALLLTLLSGQFDAVTWLTLLSLILSIAGVITIAVSLSNKKPEE
ncbi:hypothetical protein ACFQ0P_12280 [Microbacterium insulae]|uniref:Uncharacterized protein n=1 Tax=Microbacterium insulae TaxID=483014 RepID=A0ABW3ALL1_9MICO